MRRAAAREASDPLAAQRHCRIEDQEHLIADAIEDLPVRRFRNRLEAKDVAIERFDRVEIVGIKHRFQDRTRDKRRCHDSAQIKANVASAPSAVRTAWSLPHFSISARDAGPAASAGVASSFLFTGMMTNNV